WSMAYIQAPLVYDFANIGTGCGLIAAHAAAILGRNTYWMGQKRFFAFGDGGVQPVECPVWDTVFNNLSTSAAAINKIFAGANEAFNEIWWFFPSSNASECDSFVKWNPQLGAQGWDYAIGAITRTAWLKTSVFGMPL